MRIMTSAAGRHTARLIPASRLSSTLPFLCIFIISSSSRPEEAARNPQNLALSISISIPQPDSHRHDCGIPACMREEYSREASQRRFAILVIIHLKGVQPKQAAKQTGRQATVSCGFILPCIKAQAPGGNKGAERVLIRSPLYPHPGGNGSLLS